MFLRASLILSLLFALPSGGDAAPPVIVIDPGHGGSAVAGSLDARSNSSPNNATSPTGLKEKDLTLEFSLILEKAIHEEAKRQGRVLGVLLTRTSDVNLDFIERSKICDRPDTSCVVSIHFNATSGAKVSGSVALIAAKNRNPDYEVDRAFAAGLAAACSRGVREFLPQSKDQGVIHDSHLHGGRGSNFFFQLQRRSHLRGKPKCFLEIEYIDHPGVEATLLKDNRADKFAVIARSLASYLVAVTEERAQARP